MTDIFTWRTAGKLGIPTITARLNASPAAYPPPSATPGWTASAVRAILANPKYTGHQVFGRRRTRNGRRVNAPASEWLWSPETVHEPIVDMQTWREAQDIGAEHSTSRDDQPAANPAGRIFPYRSRVRCRDCRRRMAANPYPAHVYYRCPHNPASPRHTAAHPGHPRTVQAPETLLDTITGRFLNDRVFTHRRAAYLAAQLPASDAEAEARRDADAAALRAQITKLDRQQTAQITALEDIDPDHPASPAMRARICDRFAELHQQRTDAETRLAALAAARPRAADPGILDELPYCEDILHRLPPALKARLFAAIDLNLLWNKTSGQVTAYATITDATLAALPGILDPDQAGYHDAAAPAPASNNTVWALPQPYEAINPS